MTTLNANEGQCPAVVRQGMLAGLLAAVLGVSLVQPASAGGQDPVVRIAVFDFELDDRSASGGVIEKDDIDVENLAKSTEEARRMLEETGRFSIVDVAEVSGALTEAGGVRDCDGCEAGLAETLGADQSMAGIFARVSRTEYTLQIVVRDARTGEIVANHFTGLRLGANYAWPRGVTWLMKNRILAAQPAR